MVARRQVKYLNEPSVAGKGMRPAKISPGVYLFAYGRLRRVKGKSRVLITSQIQYNLRKSNREKQD